jgi:hypothetical protein
MPYLTITLAALASACGLYCGWHRNTLRLAVWGAREENLRAYAIKKLLRLGLLICLIGLLLVTAHFLAIDVFKETNNKWSVGVVIAAAIVPPLAGVVVCLLWWLSELLGYLLPRLVRRRRVVGIAR